MSRGEPEVGSVIESRIDAIAHANEKMTLGRDQRTCETCGREWIGPAYCGQGTCRGLSFTSVTIGPTVIELRGRGIAAVVEALKPKATASVIDLFVLRSLRATLIDSVNRLQEADAQLHRLVNVNATNHEVFGFLQAALHQFTESGDYELRIIDPLKMTSLVPVLRGLIAEIERTLANYEKEKNKK
jgi:hypothetical protein